jgi:carboxynorspermidine decarboxylase
LDIRQVPSPCYLCDLGLLRRNLELLGRVQQESGAEVICALKGFALFSTFPLVRQYLKGAAASSLHEARLAREEMGGQVHVYAPAYREDDFDAILGLADHLSFNSFSQWRRFRERVRASPRPLSCGIRVNPEYAEVGTDLYNPCVPYSRLGVVASELREDELDGIEGLHFHALCEQGAEVLERVLGTFEARFGRYLARMRWVNFGGGHHITRQGYEVERLIDLIRAFRARHGVRVILEPGEAVGWQTGVLVATVEDLVHNGMDIAILDVSATAHMPDVLEMPYRPEVRGAGLPGEFPHTYRLGGTTCLAGDVVGDYSFPEPLRVGDRVVLEDMIHYTMVKTTTFNGVKHPSIGLWTEDGIFRLVRTFGYKDYRNRLS